jgi:crossover junction endodeoxyribonuclease RuvC
MDNQLILGIDPGLNVTGIGIIKTVDGKNPELVMYGQIRTSPKKSLAERIYKIFSELNKLMSEYAPGIAAIENIFYAENVKTAITMGHARGAAMTAAMFNNAAVKEYSPREIKMSVAGSGAAAKSQVKYMVRNILGIREDIQPDDASDALAAALCYWHRSKNDRLGLK